MGENNYHKRGALWLSLHRKITMPRHETDIELRVIIIGLKKTGNFTISQISRITNRPPSTISTITGRYQRHGTLNNSIRAGRPKNLNAWEERHLLLLARKHRFASARQLLSWASLSGCISVDTASRIFRRNNLTSTEALLKTWSSYSPSSVGSRAERLDNRRMEAFLLYRRINI
jgi:transposase